MIEKRTLDQFDQMLIDKKNFRKTLKAIVKDSEDYHGFWQFLGQLSAQSRMVFKEEEKEVENKIITE